MTSSNIVLSLLAAVLSSAMLGAADLKPPDLLDFSVTPTFVDVTSGPASILVKIAACDDLSGFGSGSTGNGSIDIRSVSGSNPFGRGSLPITGGSGLCPVFEFTLTVPQFSPAGEYPIELTLLDNVFNTARFSSAELQKRGFSSVVVVRSSSDTTPPSLSLFSVSPLVISTWNSSADISIKILANDNLSGFGNGSTGSGSIDVRHESGSNPFGRGSLPITGGTKLNPVFEFRLTAPQYSKPGRYPIDLTLVDNVFNSSRYTAADLERLGFPGSITIVDAVESPTPTRFVPVFPCRIIDTRGTTGQFGGPSIIGQTSRSVLIPSGPCGIPLNAEAYSLNVTVVPQGPLSYLTIWPSGQLQPLVSTLNSGDGRIKANAAIVPAGTKGAVSVFVTNTADVILDINGYFVSAANAPANALQFYPLTPCRISDTRNASGSLGGPSLAAGVARSIPVATTCGVPAGAQAYSLNFTSVPNGPLAYISTWPTGQPQPLVSTLNAPTGAVTANAAIVPAGTGGSINVYASNASDLVIDINGYFAAPSASGLSFYSVTPCRISDTRNPPGAFGGPTIGAGQTRSWPIVSSACGPPAGAKAYALNATVVPVGPLSYLTLWPSGGVQPLVSTLNSGDGTIVANAAIVPASAGGSVTAFATNLTDLILDVSGYFAP